MANPGKELENTDAIVDALMSDVSRERHKFIDKVDMDRVVATLLRLTMEISVLRERLDAHEGLAKQHGVFGPADVDAYQPTPEEQDQRNERRSTLIARIVRDLT